MAKPARVLSLNEKLDLQGRCARCGYYVQLMVDGFGEVVFVPHDEYGVPSRREPGQRVGKCDNLHEVRVGTAKIGVPRA